METILRPVPPFSFELTAGYQTYFRGEAGADVFDGSTYRRVLDIDGKWILASVTSNGSIEDPELVLRIKGDELTQGDLQKVMEKIAWMLGFDVDLKPFYAVAAKDSILSRLVSRFYGMKPTRVSSIFEALVMGIAGQQIAAPVALNLRNRLAQECGYRFSADGRTYYSFPDPQTLVDVGILGLRKLYFSTRKAEYIVGISQGVLEKSLDLDSLVGLSDAEVIQRLSQIRGIGVWTAKWVLLRGLGRPNAFPVEDLALRRMIADLYFDGKKITAEEAENLAQSWQGFRSYATVYLFAAKRLGI